MLHPREGYVTVTVSNERPGRLTFGSGHSLANRSLLNGPTISEKCRRTTRVRRRWCEAATRKVCVTWSYGIQKEPGGRRSERCQQQNGHDDVP
jgi:hypothetical protein